MQDLSSLPFTVKFWGVRGTLPCAQKRFMRYGGNTTCLEVTCGDQHFIFDAGSGLHELGLHIQSCEQRLITNLFITHTHIDHILGLPFFKPAYNPKNRISIWAGHLVNKGHNIKQVLDDWLHPAYFPVPINMMRACVSFFDFPPGTTIDIAPGISIDTIALNHPGGATGYKLRAHGKSLSIITDTEHQSDEPDPELVSFIKNTDALIYDTTYSDEEYPQFVGWGHSTWQHGIKLADQAQVKRYITFHHSPGHDDDKLDSIAAELKKANPDYMVAQEGMVLDL